MSFRLKDFSDDEIVVLDCALSDDEGSWHDEEKEEIRKALAKEIDNEVEERNLSPEK